jgi:hypothetical protein
MTRDRRLPSRIPRNGLTASLCCIARSRASRYFASNEQSGTFASCSVSGIEHLLQTSEASLFDAVRGSGFRRVCKCEARDLLKPCERRTFSHRFASWIPYARTPAERLAGRRTFVPEKLRASRIKSAIFVNLRLAQIHHQLSWFCRVIVDVAVRRSFSMPPMRNIDVRRPRNHPAARDAVSRCAAINLEVDLRAIRPFSQSCWFQSRARVSQLQAVSTVLSCSR